MTGQVVTDAGPTGAGLLYDARRGVYYARPALRGWLHALCFWASLAGGAALLARAHGAVQITATAVYSASLSALFATSTLYHRGTWTDAWRALSYHRRWPDPYPSLFGYHEVFHVHVCAAAACQYAAIARFIG